MVPKRVLFGAVTAAALGACALALAACPAEGEGGGGGNTAVTFLSVTPDGRSGAAPTTRLILIFNKAIAGLTAGDITLTGVSGVTRGTLTNTSGGTYTLPITGFTQSGTLTVAVSKSGYAISPLTRTVNIFYASTINLTDSTCAGSNVSHADGVFTIHGGAVTVSGTTRSGRLAAQDTAEITLNNASITLSSGDASPLDLADGANVTLRLAGTNTLTAAGGGAGVHVTAGRTLRITSAAGDGQESGSLHANGGWSGAGIGGSQGEDGGAITIAGGSVYATGYYSPEGDGADHHNAGAGIGGGGRNAADGGADGGDFGTISITGGYVEASGGGEETAYAGEGAAGIGGGGGAYGTAKTARGSVTISGGRVQARGGMNSAGIGGGVRQSGGNITISGGAVIEATGGYMGAGIGGGYYGSGGTITITGGMVNAAGESAGIGGGYMGSGGVIRINYPSGTSSGTAQSECAGGVGPGEGGSGGSFNGGAFPAANPYTW
ncbi:MAG: hypothetical protein MdMp014T_2327 [Treponematales bacterium]